MEGLAYRQSGASPRGRRNPRASARPTLRARCISAWAEEPRASSARVTRAAVHLRVGGGTSPRAAPLSSRRGASPRGRRNPPVAAGQSPQCRCISAWAEEPQQAPARRRGREVHLRVGGGTDVVMDLLGYFIGASPRGRRNRERVQHLRLRLGCISAWAEEPGRNFVSTTRCTVHLRVGGGTRRRGRDVDRREGASPRGRRNRIPRGQADQLRRCISAWAEEPKRGRSRIARFPVHLRVGGGTVKNNRILD